MTSKNFEKYFEVQIIYVPLQRQMIRRGERNQKTRHPKVPLS